MWAIRYAKECGLYPVKGNQSIAWLTRLLARPNRALTAADVLGDPEGKLAADALLRDEAATDLEGVRRIRERIKEIEDDAEVIGWTGERENERIALLKQLEKAAQNKRLRSPAEAAHHNIASELRARCKKLAGGGMAMLAAHLIACPKLARPHFGYYPPAGTHPWKI
jgi:hypothetical protein